MPVENLFSGGAEVTMCGCGWFLFLGDPDTAQAVVAQQAPQRLAQRTHCSFWPRESPFQRSRPRLSLPGKGLRAFLER